MDPREEIDAVARPSTNDEEAFDPKYDSPVARLPGQP